MVQFLKIDSTNKDQAIPPYLRKQQQQAEQPKAKDTKARKAKAPAKKAKGK